MMVASRVGMCNSRRRLRSQLVSAAVFATPLYSASALERETVCCRFDDQETRLSPIKTQNQEVERLESGQPPQSASEYAVSFKDFDGFM
ncbi:hypothetical protein HanRHA438_Chr10g0442061 [Helianthus annuus]|nr:hypothetical protein HanHA300_Chr10g0353381 [Helianthus annuus]KAJ0529196.1 hypothetical protein HanHA89_Chr10g0375011 [Helianthus annuus]KAJ0878639.1 hypothetical protein HanRHA438_Chr10g0442061 [Helianthus annuus]